MVLLNEAERHAKTRQAVLVQRVIAVLKEENAALASMDFARAGDLLSVKFGVADALASACRSSQDEVISYAAKQDLSCLIEQNRTLVKALTNAQRRALDLMTHAIKKSSDRRKTCSR